MSSVDSQSPRNPSQNPHLNAVHEHLVHASVHSREQRHVLGMLTEGWQPLDRLIREPGVARRTVEELLSTIGDDLESRENGYRLAPGVVDSYRDAFDLPDTTTVTNPQALPRLREFITSGPRPDAALDHVTATPESVLRRAEWLRDHYDLAGAHVLCLGDHDLTSLALGLLTPTTSVTVVDLDDRILEHIDTIASSENLPIRTVHADLRFGLPPATSRWADIVCTDPPYTPEGIGLFASRAAETLADSNGRIVIAYGYSNRHPKLGHKVQQQLLRAGMVFEAILPRFHRYYGAQAIGSASDLYVCQPTTRARKSAGRHTPGIYTHGPQSVESSRTTSATELVRAVAQRTGATTPTLRAAGWDQPLPDSDEVPAFDLRADPGPWLLRMLLACNAEQAAFIVGNHHPDITSEAAQRGLAELVTGKFDLRFHRSSPDSQHAIVVASRQGDTQLGQLLRRAHGKIGNVWRDAVISASPVQISQRQATEHVRTLAPHPDDLDLRLIDLPRHRLAALVTTAATPTAR